MSDPMDVLTREERAALNTVEYCLSPDAELPPQEPDVRRVVAAARRLCALVAEARQRECEAKVRLGEIMGATQSPRPVQGPDMPPAPCSQRGNVMAETRYWRCKTCGAVYYNDPKTAPADWAWGCGKCFNPMEPVVVLPVAEHAALVALRRLEDAVRATPDGFADIGAYRHYLLNVLFGVFEDRAALRAGGKP